MVSKVLFDERKSKALPTHLNNVFQQYIQGIY